MPANWWMRFGTAVFAVVVSIVLVAPTFVHPGFDPDDRETWPGWYSALNTVTGGARITWGLDLQGGLHLQYQVDVEKAISDRVDRYVDEIGRDIRRRHPDAQVTVRRIPGAPALRVESQSGPARELLDEDQLALLNLNVATEAGGTVRLEVDSAFIEQTKEYAINQAIETIRKRIDALGTRETSVLRRGATDIVVQLPGLDEALFEQTKAIIAQTAQLEFKLVPLDSTSFLVSNPPTDATGIELRPGGLPRATELEALRRAYENVTPPDGTEIAFARIERVDPTTGQMEVEGYEPMLLEAQTHLTGEYIADARVSTDPQTNRPVVSLTFDGEGARVFGELTTNNVDRQMAIVLDGVVSSAPNINEPILGGRAQISMGRSGSYNQMLAEAESLVIVLRNGALPAPIEKQFETQVGPSLGADSIRAGAISLFLSFVLVGVFMMYWYRLSGVFATLALAANVLMVGALLALLGATLTLPGIAGITLTVGMAVDANVIIFERVKEELARGRTPGAAVTAGFEKAFTAILDANLTTAIAGLVLLEVGSGPVKGFAVTLLIGIVTTLVTAMVFSRAALEWLVRKPGTTRLSI